MLPVASIFMVPTINASTLNSSHVTIRRARRPVQELNMQTMSMEFHHVSILYCCLLLHALGGVDLKM